MVADHSSFHEPFGRIYAAIPPSADIDSGVLGGAPWGRSLPLRGASWGHKFTFPLQEWDVGLLEEFSDELCAAALVVLIEIHLLDPCVDDALGAVVAGHDRREESAVHGIPPREVDGVGLRVERANAAVPSFNILELVTCVVAVFQSCRRTVVAGGHDAIGLYDHSADLLAVTSGASGHKVSDAHEVVVPRWSHIA